MLIIAKLQILVNQLKVEFFTIDKTSQAMT